VLINFVDQANAASHYSTPPSKGIVVPVSLIVRWIKCNPLPWARPPAYQVLQKTRWAHLRLKGLTLLLAAENRDPTARARRTSNLDILLLFNAGAARTTKSTTVGLCCCFYSQLRCNNTFWGEGGANEFFGEADTNWGQLGMGMGMGMGKQCNSSVVASYDQGRFQQENIKYW